MSTRPQLRLVGAAALAALGLVVVGATLGLPWTDADLRLGPAVRIAMALAGAAIVLIANWPGPRRNPVLAGCSSLLGLTVLIYPSSLAIHAAGLGGRVIDVLAVGGHIVPLVLVQLLPVLASRAVTGRSLRWWLLAIVGVAVVGVLLTLVALVDLPSAALASNVGSVLWLGSFALAPIASWTAVRGRHGEVRRRAVVAGLASVVPVVIIALCMALGAAAQSSGMETEASVTALMTGFSLATIGSAGLVAAATGVDDNPLLGVAVILRVLAGLLLAATVLIAAGVGLTVAASGVHVTSAVLVAVLLAVVVGLGAGRLHAWAANAVDPLAELGREFAAVGPVPDGAQRRAAEQALRRVVGDPGLTLVVRAADGTWLDVVGDPQQQALDDSVVLSGASDGPRALATGVAPSAVARLRRLGDCGPLLGPAIAEATIDRESRRADAAARSERERLTQDMHDGLQGRLLGIALNLQLTGQQFQDPTARLVVEETVAALRDAVEEVRSLAGGRLPALLVEGGLQPALADLVRPLAVAVDLDVLSARLSPEIEAAAYFVVGESISNAIKHGRSRTIGVRVAAESAGQLAITVSDDGVGGADPRRGSGLRGLAERVAASGGVLVVRDAQPHGTVVEASLPCGS